jgi:plastocyanin
MTMWGRRISVKLIATVVAVAVVGGLVAAVAHKPSREITLVARGMAFYLEGGATPNPELRVKAGEHVRVIFRNEDRGMTHDFAVPSMHTASSPVGWTETTDVTVDVLDTPGTYEYECRPHRLMMRGKIIVE